MKSDKKEVKNPAFRSKGLYEQSATPVTKRGVIMKTLLMLVIVIMSAVTTGVVLWDKVVAGDKTNLLILALVGLLLTLALSLVIVFKPLLAKPLGLIYAVVEGYILGVISAFATQADGGHVVPTALLATLSIVVATNLLYTAGLVKVNDKFMSIVFMMTMGAFVFYLIVMVGGFFGLDRSFLFDGSPLSIGIGLLMLLIASLNLFSDYKMVDIFIEEKTDKKYEWYLSFGLILTIVWVYLEVLRIVQNFNK